MTIPRFSLRQLLGFVLLVSVACGLWRSLIHRVLVVHLPPDVDLASTHHQAVRHDKPSRTVAVADGALPGGTHVFASLYLVQAGTVTFLSQDEEHLLKYSGVGAVVSRRIRLSLHLSESTPIGRHATDVEITSDRAGYASGFRRPRRGLRAPLDDRVHVATSATMTGEITQGLSQVIYAEGDSPITITREMTVEEFAAKNRDNFRVVTLDFR
jgi:hypothetical protein